ncbi:MAG TPA: DUF4398 domain-containing protein [Vicinamibacterales bacterium]|nr:DUF4398 domain-containing protein [Vicinamibacterales bacterium]
MRRNGLHRTPYLLYFRPMRRLSVLLCLLLIAGCSEPPQKELNQAQGAIDAARAAGAEEYAKDEYGAATSALQKAHDAVQQRDYKQALSYALDARERGQDAARAAADGKAAARSQAEASIIALSTHLKELERRLQAAQTARVPARALRPPRAALDATREALQEAGTDLARGDFHQASAAVANKEPAVDAALKAVNALIAAHPIKKRRR